LLIRAIIENRMRLVFFNFLLFISFKVFAQTPPYSYDLRDVNGESYVTPVKEQVNGTCWAYAALASMESNLLITNIWNASGEIGIPDLSDL